MQWPFFTGRVEKGRIVRISKEQVFFRQLYSVSKWSALRFGYSLMLQHRKLIAGFLLNHLPVKPAGW
jgi:hypothetical protein